MKAAHAAGLSLAVVGDCGADAGQLANALAEVRAKNWRALTRWPGSYLAVARSGETLAVIGDLAGQHPVYWRADAAGTWWSTAASALAALDEAPVDVTALAAHLAFGQPDVLATRSLFRDVKRVPGGHLLLLAPGAAAVERYEPVAYPTVDLQQQGPVVRAALAEAVATRIDDRPVSADLAGLDSTTLACLAAQRTPVTAVTFADERLRDDDLSYAARTVATVPGLAHHTVAGAPGTVYYAGLDDLSTLPVTDAPNAYAVTASIKRTVLNTVAANTPSPGVHFTGPPATPCSPPPRRTSPTCCASGGTATPGNTPSATPGCATRPPSPSSPTPGRPRASTWLGPGGRQPLSSADPHGTGFRKPSGPTPGPRSGLRRTG